MDIHKLLRDEYIQYILITNNNPLSYVGPQHEPCLTINDLASIDQKELYDFGFRNWDEQLILLPIWVIGLLCDGEVLISIFQDKKPIFHDQLDIRSGEWDTRRGGVTAWGFYRKIS